MWWMINKVLELFYSRIKTDQDEVVNISGPAKHYFPTGKQKVQNNTDSESLYYLEKH